jgi:hypothetical protein
MSAPAIDESSGRARAWERSALALIVVAAFWLRTRDIESFFAGPDEGSYLHSALVHELPRGFDPLRWVREDVAWVKHLADHYREETVTYQHSYVHQWVTRYLYRSGCGAIESLRLSTAITGTLTVLFAWWFFAKVAPARRRVGLLAAALVAFAPFHVFYSRTGWGQIGCSAFYLVYATFLYRVLVVIPDGDSRALRRAGFGMLVASLLAFGWHEGVAPYIVGSGIVVVLAPLLFPRASPSGGWLAQSVRSPRTWTYAWSAIPVGAATLALALWSPFAQKYWFNTEGRAGLGWWDLKTASFVNLFDAQRVDLQLGWIPMALALFGWISLRRRDRALARYLVASALAGSAILFVGFGDAFLARIYMPAFVLLLVLAAEGLHASAQALAMRLGHLAGATLVALVLGLLAAISWMTSFGRVENPLFVQRLYAQTSKGLLDHRHVDEPIRAHLLADKKPGERVGVFGDKAAIFRLQDVGIEARENYLEGTPDTWPEWLVGSNNVYPKSPFARAHPDEYKQIVGDTIARWTLYRRATP